MRIRFVWGSGSCTAVLLALALPVSAQSPSPERAVLWYRSAGDCPDGAGFLARAGDRARLVRLAEAGDRADFVVSVTATPEGASGRLERQTDRGTVAIREFEAESCERVADVLALNLALALDPARRAPEAAGESSALPTGDGAAAEEPPTGDGAMGQKPAAAGEGGQRSEHGQTPAPAPNQPEATRVGPPEKKADQAAAGPKPARWRVGVQGGALGGVSPELLARGAAFVELDGAFAPTLPDMVLRAAAVGAVGSSDTSSGDVQQSLVAGRLDVCLAKIDGRVLSVSPCGAGEVGQVRASGTYRDSGLWAALGLHGRGLWMLGGPVALEAEVGAMYPLSRYEVHAGSTVLYRTALVGLSAVLGASVGFE